MNDIIRTRNLGITFENALFFLSSNSQCSIKSYGFLPPQYLSNVSTSLHLHCYSSSTYHHISLRQSQWINTISTLAPCKSFPHCNKSDSYSYVWLSWDPQYQELSYSYFLAHDTLLSSVYEMPFSYFLIYFIIFSPCSSSPFFLLLFLFISILVRNMMLFQYNMFKNCINSTVQKIILWILFYLQLTLCS